MMFELYDIVLIKDKDIKGTIVDIAHINSDVIYVVESNIPWLNDGYGGKWKLFDCKEDELIKL